MDIDIPDVRAEMEAAFARYEAAILANNVPTLNALFRCAPETIRYGMAENLYGHDEIAAFRSARSPTGLARRLARTVITAWFKTCHFQVTPEIDRAVMVKGFLVLGVTLI